MKTLETENAELQDLNEELVRELEKRDQAIKEAVNLICELEDKLDMVGLAVRDTQPSTAMPVTEHSTDSFFPPSSPPLQPSPVASQTPASADKSRQTTRPSVMPTFRLDYVTAPSPSKSSRRTPSFLRENNGSTNALRSLYLSDDNLSKGAFSSVSLPRPGSLFSREDNINNLDPDDYNLNSPRLSVLSESSFLSVYVEVKHNQQDDGNLGMEEQKRFLEDARGTSLSRETQRSAKTNRWIDEKSTPSKPSRTSPKNAARKSYMSINEVIEPQSQSLEDAVLRGTPQRELSGHVSRKHSREKEQKSPSQTEPIRKKDLLPPTPETMTRNPSEGRNNSTPSIIAEKILIDGTPTPERGFSTLLPTERPRTAENRVRQPSPNYSQAYIKCSDTSLLGSDDETESTRVEQSEDEDEITQGHSRQASYFMGGSSKYMQGSRGRSSSRALKTYGIDMMFNGEGIQGDHLPQTTSYSSPTSVKRRQSVQYPLPEHRPSTRTRIETTPAQALPKVRRSASNATAIPTRRAHLNRAVSVSHTHEEYETPSPSHQQSVHASTDTTNVYLPPSSSARPENLRTLPTANLTSHKNFVSRIFRRSNSHTAPSFTDISSQNPSLKPPSSYAPSSNTSTHSTKPRPTGTYIPNSRSPSTHTDHSTSTSISKIARPGTAGSLDTNRTQPHPRRQGAHYHDNTSSSGERINTPGTEQSDVLGGGGGGYARQETLAVRGREGTRPQSQEAVRGSEEEEDGSAGGGVGRNRVGRGSVDEGSGSGGRKWGMGIGRSASLRIREGLGRRKGDR